MCSDFALKNSTVPGRSTFFGAEWGNWYEKVGSFRNLFNIFLASVGTFSGFLFYFYFSVPYFGLACDHGNSFLCLEE